MNLEVSYSIFRQKNQIRQKNLTRSNNSQNLEAVLNLFRDRLRPMFEADWSPRYAVNSGLLTKIKGFKMRDRGSIWPEHTCLK